MKPICLAGMFAAFLMSGQARAEVVTFDFNSLGLLDRDRAISDYMTDVYGSTVTTDGAVSSNNRSDIPMGQTDRFIATSFQLLNRGDFEILFEDVPITAARFEGHVIDATFGDDFILRAFNGNTLVFQFHRNDGVEIFETDWLFFSQPVNRLVVSDAGRKDVGIDDLMVQPVPEPHTAIALLLGAAALRFCRRIVP